MKQLFKQKSIIILLGLVVVSALLFFLFRPEKPNLVYGGVNDNIRGWAWSGADAGGSYRYGIGWISLNCYNDYNNDGLPENCCPAGSGCPYSNASYAYGLNLNTSNNKISGYAWSPNVGWVCFGETCAATAPDNLSAWACVGASASNGVCTGTGKFVFGWARVMWSNQPNDGWLKLRGQTTGGITYGLSLEDFGFSHKELTGFAWSHSYNPQISGAGSGWLGFGYQSYCLTRLPSQVENLTVSPVSQNCQSLLLKWDPAQCAQSYKIYRCWGTPCQPTTGGELIANILVSDSSLDCTGNQCKWQDSGLSGGVTYSYQIQAWNLNGEGVISDIARGTTVFCGPGVPTQPTISSKCGEIVVCWSPVPGATGYNVYRAVKNKDDDCAASQCRKIASGFSCGAACGEALCSYTDKSILANVRYYYWVSACADPAKPCQEGDESPLVYFKDGQSTCLPPTQWQER